MSTPNTQIMPAAMCLAHLAHHIDAVDVSNVLLEVAFGIFIKNRSNPDIYMRVMDVALSDKYPPDPRFMPKPTPTPSPTKRTGNVIALFPVRNAK